MSSAASFETFEQEIIRLVAAFDSRLAELKKPTYGEMQLRTDFLDPFFAALGWDMTNRAGLIQAHREVVIEWRTDSGRADYFFRADRKPRFVCEAKKPAEDLPPHAQQAKSYAWTISVPLAVLSDFEELHIYVVGSEPKKEEPLVGLWRTYSFREYTGRARELWELLGRDSVAGGVIERTVAALPKKPLKIGKDQWIARPDPTKNFDNTFLAELDTQRRSLAADLLRNNESEKWEGLRLNEAVQCILDRLLFIRISEARGIDMGTLLKSLLETWQKRRDSGGGLLREEPPAGWGDAGLTAPRGSLWHSVVCHVRALDRRPPSHVPFFNGDLLKPHFSEELVVGDDWLEAFLDKICNDFASYKFGYVAVEILGTIYERFLGKVVRAHGRGAVIEDKPEVRKAGGVYYTPRYIVEYIVEQTVGKLLAGKKPAATLQLRFLDPACGSGSFLLRVFERVCEHWEQWLIDHPEQRKKDWCWRDSKTNTLFLTARLKRQILRETIYGVDLDPQAVEVTQLSLYLKMLEGETAETLQREQDLFNGDEAILPPLHDNIQCGNSLIGSNFLEGALPTGEVLGEMQQLRALDWGVAFRKAMKAGGFDAVVGNPPYVRQESLKATKTYLEKHYESFSGTGDLYTYFMEKGVKLLRPGGRYSIIVSSSFLRATYAEALRETLLRHAALVRIVDFGGLAVFADAKDTYVCIPVLAKEKQPDQVEVSKVGSLEPDRVMEEMSKTDFVAPLKQFTRDAWSLRSKAQTKTFAKILKAGEPLGSYVSKRIFYGIKTGLNEAFVVTTEQRNKLVASAKASSALIHPCRGGEDVREYFIEPADSWLIVIPAGWTRSQMGTPRASVSEAKAWDWLRSKHPGIAGHLEPFTKALRARQDQGDFWWELRPCDYYDTFDRPKLVYPDICKHPRFTYDDTGIYLTNTAYALGTGDKYLLGILNSRLFWFAISNISIPFGVRAGEFRYRLIYQYMEKIPVRKLDLDKPAEKAAHDRMVDLVNRRLFLTPRLRAATITGDKAVLQNAVTATDQHIDQLVYELYGLTDEEIALVEG